VKFEANKIIIGNLRAGGVQEWFSCVGLDRFAPEIKYDIRIVGNK